MEPRKPEFDLSSVPAEQLQLADFATTAETREIRRFHAILVAAPLLAAINSQVMIFGGPRWLEDGVVHGANVGLAAVLAAAAAFRVYPAPGRKTLAAGRALVFTAATYPLAYLLASSVFGLGLAFGVRLGGLVERLLHAAGLR